MELLKRILSFLATPLMEDGKPSIGRVMLVATFALAIYKWKSGINIPDTQMTMLITLVGYVIGSKTLGTISDVTAKLKEIKDNGKSILEEKDTPEP